MAQDISQLLPLLQALISMPAAQPIVRQIWRSMTGGNPLDMAPGLYNTDKTIGQNLWMDRNSQEMRSMFEGGIASASTYGTNAFLRGWMELRGISRERADQIIKNNQVGKGEQLLANLLIRPRYEAAAKKMAWALHGRRTQWEDGSIFGIKPADKNYAEAGSRMIDSTLTSAIDGDFYGMGVQDVGTLASQMIGAGTFDKRGTETSKHNKQGNEQRINRFKAKLDSYARSVNILQDVIEGPMETILESFETLTGSRLVATSTGRVNALAQGMRNVLSTGEISQEGLRKLVANQYEYIAPYGGNKLAATSQALFTAAAIASGPRVEGVSRDDMAAAWGRQNAKAYAQGTQQKWGAAYAHFLDKNPIYKEKGNESLGQAAFMEAVGKGGIDAYIRREGISYSEMTSATARSYANDPVLIAASKASIAKNFTNARSRILKSHGLAGDILKGIYDPREMEEALKKTGKVNAAQASRIVRQITASAQAATGEVNGDVALQMVGDVTNAQRTLEQNRSVAMFGTVASGLLDAKNSGSMLDRLINTVAKRKMGQTDLAAVMSGLFGVPDREIRKAISDAFGGKPIDFGANDADAKKAAEKAATAAVMAGTGMNAKDAEDYWNKYSPLAAKRQGLAMTLGMAGVVTNKRAAADTRLAIMQAAEKGELTYELLDSISKDKSKGISFSGDEMNRMVAQSTLKGELGKKAVSDEEVKNFANVQAAWKGQLGEKNATKVAAWALAAKRHDQLLRETAQAKGVKLTDKDRAAELAKLQKNYGLDSMGIDAKQLEAMRENILSQQENGAEAWLQKIYQWLVNFKPNS